KYSVPPAAVRFATPSGAPGMTSFTWYVPAAVPSVRITLVPSVPSAGPPLKYSTSFLTAGPSSRNPSLLLAQYLTGPISDVPAGAQLGEEFAGSVEPDGPGKMSFKSVADSSRRDSRDSTAARAARTMGGSGSVNHRWVPLVRTTQDHLWPRIDSARGRREYRILR